MGHLVFVYGSLMRGLCNHGVLEGAGGGDSATLCSLDLEMVSLGAFPALVQRKEPHSREGASPRILGEVYRVSDEGLRDLDMLEGHPRFYRRRLLGVCSRDAMVDAWVYALDREAREHETLVGQHRRLVAVPGNWAVVSWRRHLNDRDCGLSQQGGAS